MRRLLLCLIAVLSVSLHLSAEENPGWTQPFPPFKIAGNLYYVGSADLAAYLIVTTEGNILINSNLQSSPGQIRKSVEKLGFRWDATRILLISHAHFDHCAGSASILRQTHAKYMVMDADVKTVETGGKEDFAYGNRPDFCYAPAKVDRALHDGDEVKLGGSVLVAHLTGGHTRGCTTWTMKVQEEGRSYDVVIVGSPNVNPGYRLLGDPKYPQMAADYEHEFQTLKRLHCDIFLGAHGGYFGLEDKFAHIGKGGENPFVDPAGYAGYVQDREQAFQKELRRQRGQ